MEAGTCVVGALGGPAHRVYTALGPAVDTAGRLEASGGPGTIALGASIARLLTGRARLRETDDGDFELLALTHADRRRGTDPPSSRVTLLRSVDTSSTSPPARHARIFRREGEYWTIAYAGAVFRLRDAKGARYIAMLLGRPREDIHVFDLVAPTGDGLLAEISGDAGVLLDERAKAAYRGRIRELEEELEEAREFADAGRISRAEMEKEALARELSAAVGLGGRDRRAAAATERVRINVTRAIKSTIAKIAESNAELGRYLQTTIRTGGYCSYLPYQSTGAELWEASG
jgi:hypothetical protein